MDPDQTGPVTRQKQSDLDLHHLSKWLLKHFNRHEKQTTFVIGALRVKLILDMTVLFIK